MNFLSRLYNKPVVLTEFGCQSKHGVLTKPVDWWLPGAPDVLVQAMFYEGFFKELSADMQDFGKENPDTAYPLTSIWIWNYTPGRGGPKNTDYTFRNKPMTEKVISGFVEKVSNREDSGSGEE